MSEKRNGTKVVCRAVVDENDNFIGFAHIKYRGGVSLKKETKRCNEKARKFGKPYGNIIIGYIENV